MAWSEVGSGAQSTAVRHFQEKLLTAEIAENTRKEPREISAPIEACFSLRPLRVFSAISAVKSFVDCARYLSKDGDMT
jgi:hypothetical protein